MNVNSTQSAEFAQYQHHITSYLDSVVTTSGVPGICVEMLTNGTRLTSSAGVLSAQSRENISNQSHVQVGRFSRALVSMVLLQLESIGRLNTDALIGSELVELGNTEIGNTVKISQLMSQTGGYQCINLADPDVIRNFNWQRTITFLSKTRQLFKPGTVFSYSPTASILLNELVSRKTGVSAMVAARQYLSDLGLFINTDGTNTNQYSFIGTKTQRFARRSGSDASEFWTSRLKCTMSLDHIVRLLTTIVESRQNEKRTDMLIDANIADRLQRQSVSLPPTTSKAGVERPPISVGIGFAKLLPGWLGSLGALTGQSSMFCFHENLQAVVAIAMSAHQPAVCEGVLENILQSLGAGLGGVDSRPPSNNFTRADVCGMYVGNDGNQIKISSDGNDLFCEQLNGHFVRRISFKMTLDDRASWVVVDDAIGSHAVLFPDPCSGAPCLMVGAIALKKDT